MTKLQKQWQALRLEGKQNQVLHPHQNQGENKMNMSKLAYLVNYKKADTF